VNYLLAIDHRVAVWRERAAQRNVRIELAILVEVDDSQALGTADFSGFRFDVATHQTKQRGFAAAVRAHEAHSHA